VFRFDYWYVQEKLKQDKIKKQIEDKLRQDLQECTFQPNTQKSRTPSVSPGPSKLPATPQASQRFDLLYQKEVAKRKEKERQAKNQKQSQEQKLLAECTFKPRITSKSPAQQRSSVSPCGYDDTVNRMRMATQEKLRKKEAFEK